VGPPPSRSQQRPHRGRGPVGSCVISPRGAWPEGTGALTCGEGRRGRRERGSPCGGEDMGVRLAGSSVDIRPLGLWVACRVAGAGVDSPGWERGRPRRLRPAPVGHGDCLRWSWRPVGVRGLGDGPHICLAAPLWRGGRTPHLGEPPAVGRMSCRRQKAFRRNWAAVRSLRDSSRACVRSRMAASSTVGTETAVRAPERARRASGTASRRSVVRGSSR
jgi:hypothetical protein